MLQIINQTFWASNSHNKLLDFLESAFPDKCSLTSSKFLIKLTREVVPEKTTGNLKI